MKLEPIIVIASSIPMIKTVFAIDKGKNEKIDIRLGGAMVILICSISSSRYTSPSALNIRS